MRRLFSRSVHRRLIKKITAAYNYKYRRSDAFSGLCGHSIYHTYPHRHILMTWTWILNTWLLLIYIFIWNSLIHLINGIIFPLDKDVLFTIDARWQRENTPCFSHVSYFIMFCFLCMFLYIGEFHEQNLIMFKSHQNSSLPYTPNFLPCFLFRNYLVESVLPKYSWVCG